MRSELLSRLFARKKRSGTDAIMDNNELILYERHPSRIASHRFGYAYRSVGQEDSEVVQEPDERFLVSLPVFVERPSMRGEYDAMHAAYSRSKGSKTSGFRAVAVHDCRPYLAY